MQPIHSTFSTQCMYSHLYSCAVVGTPAKKRLCWHRHINAFFDLKTEFNLNSVNLGMNNPMHTTSRQRFKNLGQKVIIVVFFCLTFFLGRIIFSSFLVAKWKTNYDSPDGKYIFISLNSISGHFVNNQLAAQCCRGRGVKILKIIVE